ncbi:hypothetical protein R2083_00775 [Nitrosomonas sp. Is35]|uniref:hypothetical protein n=1 Tax=Nitrosomonas sp. Is35 TaxID=3080534 RepID=UPI00294B7652|nr:hypothetical protein [Nitrosomonas sp. Is35]MDV6346050.1 hypothetical protein [Nitrosomonas sp. Is35]
MFWGAQAQGIVAGANMVLVGGQALLLKELPEFLEDIQIARDAYEKRDALAGRYQAA